MKVGYLVSGKMIIRYQDEKGELAERILVAGESFHFNPGVIHQEEAITDCVIIEGSTPHFNDQWSAKKNLEWKIMLVYPAQMLRM